MAVRSLLRDQLAKAWRKTIDGEYSDQLINSERGLQVYFCKHLLDLFAEKKKFQRRLFIEPRLATKTRVEPRLATKKRVESRYPDIVICNSTKIIGIVEFKYLPRARPKYQKDLLTLDWVLRHSDSLTITNDRYRGERVPPRHYKLADDAVLCWAGVYTKPQLERIALPGNRKINSRVFALHAITQKETKTTVFPDSMN